MRRRLDGTGWNKLELRDTGRRMDGTGWSKLELRDTGEEWMDQDGVNWS